MSIIDTYRSAYAVSEHANSHASFVDSEKVLQEWNTQKNVFLFRLFDEQLIISKQISYVKSHDELLEEVADFTERRYGRVGRSGEYFYDQFWNLVLGRLDKNIRFDEATQDLMRELISDNNLIENKYNGESFDIPLPDGKTLRVASGCKVSKMLGKIAEIFKLEGYEDFRICHSQVLNQKTLEGNLTLSIHPLDYMTMSDNECGWESCMNWRYEGGYRQGTVEMMNSPYIIVAYLTADEPMKLFWNASAESYQCWNNKKWRQLFIVNHDIIAGIKDYPYHNDSLTCMVIDWIKELAKKNLHWAYTDTFKYDYENSEDTIHCDSLPEDKNSFRLCFETEYMYNDFGAMPYHWICISNDLNEDSIRKNGIYPYYFLNYSGRYQCMACGSICADFDDESCLVCSDCQDVIICDCCGERTSEVWHIDSMSLCEYCWENRVIECDVCGANHYDEDMLSIFAVPRISPEKQMEMRAEIMLDPFGPCIGPDDTEFNYSPGDSSPINVCDNYRCFEEFCHKYLIDGARPHLRKQRCSTDTCIYFDELTDEARRNYYPGITTNEEYISEYFRYRRPIPSRFIENI